MSHPRITILESQERMLREYLEAHPDKHERAAIVLFRRLCRPVQTLEDSDRYLAVEIHLFQDAWITGSSPSHIAFELSHFRDLFRKCTEDSLVFGFVHIHPSGYDKFSDVDEENERTLLTAIKNRNGTEVHFVAMLWNGDVWKARIRSAQSIDSSTVVRHVSVLGKNLNLYPSLQLSAVEKEILDRQAAAFGQPFVEKLRSLRVGVVGAGGTGSPTATLLARAGVGELVVIDKDVLESSNLNRVRGAGVKDVGKNKAAILAAFITDTGLPTRVTSIESLIDEDATAVDALSSCDVIFGCTDDQIGRELLNTALYVYLHAYIDMGLGGLVVEDANRVPKLRYHFGRVSTILPEAGECLFCQDVIRDIWIRHQYALRENPRMSREEARERYLEGGGEQAPGVGPFTSAVADYSVATLFDLVMPFRKFPPSVRRDAFKIDFVKMELRSSQEKLDYECPYCGKHEYLLLHEKYRLNRPLLGRANVAI